ncbi:hypothetical protein [Streptomyces sp. NTH33]|uniref:hypothetical protein n=1 Tax=Streptomyces sp. NTH33 TaxID=1735453 RepID=UPI0011B9410D|nr:hypothetical protein [Streptomyces sp. NTH33]
MDEHTEATVAQPVLTVVRGRTGDIELAAPTAVRDATASSARVNGDDDKTGLVREGMAADRHLPEDPTRPVRTGDDPVAARSRFALLARAGGPLERVSVPGTTPTSGSNPPNQRQIRTPFPGARPHHDTGWTILRRVCYTPLWMVAEEKWCAW